MLYYPHLGILSVLSYGLSKLKENKVFIYIALTAKISKHLIQMSVLVIIMHH